MGLVSPEILDLGRSWASPRWSTAAPGCGPPGPDRPDWLVDRSEGGPRCAGRVIDGVRFELLDSCVIHGVGLREPQPWTVALYRLVSTEI